MAIELTAYVFGDVTLTTKLLSQVAMIFGGGAFATAAKVAVLGGVNRTGRHVIGRPALRAAWVVR